VNCGKSWLPSRDAVADPHIGMMCGSALPVVEATCDGGPLADRWRTVGDPLAIRQRFPAP